MPLFLLQERMRSAIPSLCAAMLLGGLLISQPANAALVSLKSDIGDGEARQSSTGVYTVATGTPVTHLRVGFQSSFGSDGQAFGGLDAVWYFKLPQLNLAAGDAILGANFTTTLLDESAASPITPRFNADLYALGFTSTPAATADGLHFFAGQNQGAVAGLGAGQLVQKIDDDLFTVFTDWQSVNTPTPKVAKPISIDGGAQSNLLNYIQGIYLNPAFPNTGNEYLVLRLNPDRAANELYDEGAGPQPYGKGTTRYRVASSESDTLVSTGALNYDNVVPTRVTLDIIPEPGSAALLGLAALGAGFRRRRSRA